MFWSYIRKISLRNLRKVLVFVWLFLLFNGTLLFRFSISIYFIHSRCSFSLIGCYPLYCQCLGFKGSNQETLQGFHPVISLFFLCLCYADLQLSYLTFASVPVNAVPAAGYSRLLNFPCGSFFLVGDVVVRKAPQPTVTSHARFGRLLLTEQ